MIANAFLNLSAAGDGIVTGGAGSGAVFHSVVINAPGNLGVVTVYNGTSTTGSKIATISTSTSGTQATLLFDILCPKGVYAVMTGSGDVTITAG
jgi:hypothetical protein